MWGDEFNDHYHTATTSDYQTIVRDCLYLWINNKTFESKMILQTSHPNSKELIVLQNDLSVYTVFITKDYENIKAKLLCTLEDSPEGKENFAKQITRMYALQRMLLLLMTDGTINIFENQGGLFLWKTQTFRSGAPQIWIRMGNYPTAGVWNRSGIWNLRPKPIADQMREILIKQNREEKENNEKSSKFLQTPKVTDPEFALDIFEEQKKLQTTKSKKLRIKQGVNRSEDIPVRSLFDILSMWQLQNVSSETALNLAVRLKDMRETDEDNIDSSEVFYLIKIIKDPVLLLVLFGNKAFPFSVKKKLTLRLKELMQSPNIQRLDGDVLALLKQYLSTEDTIRGFFIDPIKRSPETTIMKNISVSEEFLKLDALVSLSQYQNLKALDKLLVSMMDLDQHLFTGLLLQNLFHEDVYTELDIEETVQIKLAHKTRTAIWKLFLRLVVRGETLVGDFRGRRIVFVFKYALSISTMYSISNLKYCIIICDHKFNN